MLYKEDTLSTNVILYNSNIFYKGDGSTDRYNGLGMKKWVLGPNRIFQGSWVMNGALKHYIHLIEVIFTT